MFAHIMKMAQADSGHYGNQRQPYHGPPLCLSGMPEGQELIPECEVIIEDEDDGLDSRFEMCGKNPKHKNFIPLCDFKKDHLPSDLRMDRIMDDFINPRVALTVKISIPYTSTERPDFVPNAPGTNEDNYDYLTRQTYPYLHHKGERDFTRHGTGFITSVSKAIQGRCPCRGCKTAAKPKQEYHLYTVRTVTHNVFNDEEAKVAVITCFFNLENDEEDANTRKLSGLHLLDLKDESSDGENENTRERMLETDVCDLVCASHSRDTPLRMVQQLDNLKSMPNLPRPPVAGGPFTEVIISHPHGCTKRISVGQIPCLVVPLKPKYETNTPAELPGSGTTKCYVRKSLTSSSDQKKNKGIEEGKGEMTERREIGTVPQGTTFTLPNKAAYAMKYVLESPRYLTFQPGTKFTSPEGTDLPATIPDGAEFEVADGCFPEHYYAGHTIGSCAGTSGAMVFSNLCEDEVLTDMEHTSKVRSNTSSESPAV